MDIKIKNINKKIENYFYEDLNNKPFINDNNSIFILEKNEDENKNMINTKNKSDFDDLTFTKYYDLLQKKRKKKKYIIDKKDDILIIDYLKYLYKELNIVNINFNCYKAQKRDDNYVSLLLKNLLIYYKIMNAEDTLDFTTDITNFINKLELPYINYLYLNNYFFNNDNNIIIEKKNNIILKNNYFYTFNLIYQNLVIDATLIYKDLKIFNIYFKFIYDFKNFKNIYDILQYKKNISRIYINKKPITFNNNMYKNVIPNVIFKELLNYKTRSFRLFYEVFFYKTIKNN